MSKMWFKPKRYGYGAGLPMSCEGWALLLGFIAAMGLIPYLAFNYFDGREQWLFLVGATAILVLVLIVITRAKTEGGWRWRWGRD